MEGRTCVTCPAFDSRKGLCRRLPPINSYDQDAGSPFSSFPEVSGSNWCMEHPELKRGVETERLKHFLKVVKEHLYWYGERPHGQEGEGPPIPKQPDSHEDAPRRYVGVGTDALLRCFSKSVDEVRLVIHGQSGVYLSSFPWQGDENEVVVLFPSAGRGMTPILLAQMVKELLLRGKQETPSGAESGEGSSQ